MQTREKTELIIVHCSDSSPSTTVEDIRSWHKQRGWDDIGYHYVIDQEGEIRPGRDKTLRGAHCEGDNWNSIGVCLIGKDSFSISQRMALRILLAELMNEYQLTPDALFGHRDRKSGKAQGKTCPNFDVQSWWKGA